MKNLAEAIRTVVSGKAMINPDITDKVVKLFNHMAAMQLFYSGR